MVSSITFRAVGLPEVMRALSELEGRKLSSTTRSVLTQATKTVVVPEVQAAASTAFKHHGTSPWQRPTARNPNVGKRGGPTNKKIKAKAIKRRKGEMLAIGVKADTWYRHFPIAGTRPHIIEARDASGNRATAKQIQRINKGPGGYKDPALQREAIYFDGVFRQRVYHPGVRTGNDYVNKASQRVNAGGRLPKALADELEKKFANAASTRTSP